MSPAIVTPWPLYSSRAPETGIVPKDYAGYARTLAVESSRLFRDNVVEMETCSLSDLGFQLESIQTFQQLKAHLETTDTFPLAQGEKLDNDKKITPRTDIFFLRQLHSRSQLETSEESVKFLLNRWDALPEFVNILSAFTMEDGPSNLDRSGFYADTKTSVNEEPVVEICCLLKYVELNGRNGAIPWSVRQMGVYQQFNITSRQGRCILIQPSLDLQRRMREEFDENENYTDYINYWFSFQLLCVSTLTGNWLSYTKFLEKKIADIQNSLRFTKLQVEQNGDVTFQDLQSLHHFSDLLHRAAHALKSNIKVLNSLLEESRDIQLQDSPDLAKKYESFHKILKSSAREQTFLQDHAELVCGRAERISLMLRDAMALRDSDIMKRLSRLTVSEGNLMLKLTEKTIREARTVKTITLVTLIYLPASFTSTFLSMGYIHITSSSSSAHLLQITASRELWFYLAITAPLMLVTVCGWWAWELWSRHRGKGWMGRGEVDEEKGEAEGERVEVEKRE